MLELDLLLQGFLRQGYDGLDAVGEQAFSELLDLPDALLLEFLLGRSTPVDPRVRDVVSQIRTAVAH